MHGTSSDESPAAACGGGSSSPSPSFFASTSSASTSVAQHDDVQQGEVGVAHLGDDGRRRVGCEVGDAVADVGGGGSDVVYAPRENHAVRAVEGEGVFIHPHVTTRRRQRRQTDKFYNFSGRKHRGGGLDRRWSCNLWWLDDVHHRDDDDEEKTR